MKGRHQMAWQEGRRPLAGPFAVCPGRLLTFPPGNATTRQFRSAALEASVRVSFGISIDHLWRFEGEGGSSP